jgi:hypothetical protein
LSIIPAAWGLEKLKAVISPALLGAGVTVTVHLAAEPSSAVTV